MSHRSPQPVERKTQILKKTEPGGRDLRSRFRLRALALITFLLGPVGLLHPQDWLSDESLPLSYGNRKTKQFVHSFDYRDSSRTIAIDFGGTALMPKAEGHANVETKQGGTKIEAHVRGLEPARTLARSIPRG